LRVLKYGGQEPSPFGHPVGINLKGKPDFPSLKARGRTGRSGVADLSETAGADAARLTLNPAAAL
jgi:hypothetical protein